MFVLAWFFLYWGMSWCNTGCPKGLHYGDKNNSHASHNGALWFFYLINRTTCLHHFFFTANSASCHATIDFLMESLSAVLYTPPDKAENQKRTTKLSTVHQFVEKNERKERRMNDKNHPLIITWVWYCMYLPYQKLHFSDCTAFILPQNGLTS